MTKKSVAPDRLVSFAMTLAILLTAPLSHATPTLIKSEYVYSLEEVVLPQNEKMGLAGLNYWVANPGGLYGGLGIYGAVSGDRGGFFTGGFEAGFTQRLFHPVALRSGFFVGGGGGGAAPQGGGLMLRPHAEFLFEYDPWFYSIGWSLVEFPNGKIGSGHIMASVGVKTEQWLQKGWWGGPGQVNELDLPASRVSRKLYLHQEAYWPEPGQNGRSNSGLDKRMDLIGIRWQQGLGGNWQGEFQTSGAWGGEVDGFAQVLGGFSYKVFNSHSASLGLGALIGAAGGGDVDTGGGPVSRIFSGFNLNIMKYLSIYTEFGYTQGLDGQFSAVTGSVGLGAQYGLLRPALGSRKPWSGQLFQWSRKRLRLVTQRYLSTQEGDRKGTDFLGRPVDLVGLKIDQFLTGKPDLGLLSGLYASGQAYGAFDGGAGGYAVGLVGLGQKTRLIGPDSHRPGLFIGAEFLLGAAGGGGIEVGGGRVAQAVINFGLETQGAWGAELSLGRVLALDRVLESHTNRGLNEPVVELAIQYQFATPTVTISGQGGSTLENIH